MGLFRRFFSYYRPHMGLFMLDTVVAIISSLLSVLFPLLTNYLLRGPVAEKDVGGNGFDFPCNAMCVHFSGVQHIHQDPVGTLFGSQDRKRDEAGPF